LSSTDILQFDTPFAGIRVRVASFRGQCASDVRIMTNAIGGRAGEVRAGCEVPLRCCAGPKGVWAALAWQLSFVLKCPTSLAIAGVSLRRWRVCTIRQSVSRWLSCWNL